MAVLPLRNRNKARRAKIDLARLPVLAAAFLIALFGLLAGTPRNTDITAATRPLDDRSPALTKREAPRAITVAERKDGASSHVASDDGLPPSADILLPARLYEAAKSPARQAYLFDLKGWPGALPRAPPFAA